MSYILKNDLLSFQSEDNKAIRSYYIGQLGFYTMEMIGESNVLQAILLIYGVSSCHHPCCVIILM